jgi:hypothetical protein
LHDDLFLFSICDLQFAIEGAQKSARDDSATEDYRAGGGSLNWKGEKSLRTPLADSPIGSGKLAADSMVRVGCSRTDGTVWRKLVVMRDASDRGGALRELAGAAETARSAHSAVATTITAITCLVRRIPVLEDRPEY